MPAVTLVVGDEELLVARAVQRAVQAAADVDGETDVRDIEAGDLTPGEFADLTAPSLFGDRRTVVVRSVQDASKDLVAVLAAYAAEPPADVAIVVVHAGGAKGKSVVETLKHAGAAVVPAPRVKTVRDREQFVADEIRAAGGTIDRAVASDLVAAVGSDLRELATACAQLVADVGSRVTAEHVAAYFRGRAESTGFAVADRAVEGEVAAALASQLGMPAWKIRRAQGWLRQWRPESLARAVQAVADADAGIKGAGDDAAFAAERAVITVSACAAE